MEQTKKTSFVAGAAILAFAGVLCKIIGVFIRIWAYDIIGEAGMVYYEVVFPFYSWLLIISSSGVPTAISRMVSERFSTGDFAGARRVSPPWRRPCSSSPACAPIEGICRAPSI